MTVYAVIAVFPKSEWIIKEFGGWGSIDNKFDLEKFQSISSVIDIKKIVGLEPGLTDDEHDCPYNLAQNALCEIFSTREKAQEYCDSPDRDCAKKFHYYKYFVVEYEVKYNY